MRKRSRFDVLPCEEIKRSRVGERGATTLWTGDLESWEDESHLYGCLLTVLPTENTKLTSVKIVRDPSSGYHLGYGFIDFEDHEAAAQAMEILKKSIRPGHNRRFKVSWAASNTHRQRQHIEDFQSFALYLGNLDKDITENEISEFLINLGYLTLISVKISRLENGESKGFGFVRFQSQTEFQDALFRLNGLQIGNKIVQASVAHGTRQALVAFGWEYY